jgi:chromosome segregation protein
MHLKSITLKGFKSFPDRTRLDFDSGVSVIVGPNGSGKSNVTDAVLWALGEQSPLAVRGQSMQDVIFGGAPGRRAAGSAEVELVLDDSDGSLNLGVPEISIVRRLDRTGEGEYRLAGARCRLVDLIELLSDTGLGKEMHSVISQGRVESIVTSKPRDRRLLIEEAAGLGKHRKRRRRAQLKLARTQENLDRALDVEREARSRLRPLKRQAEAAELHARLERQTLEVRWELARDELYAQRAALSEAESAAASARERREEAAQGLQAVAKRRETAEEALAHRSAQREELSRRWFASRSAGERLSYRADALAAAETALVERTSRARGTLASLHTEAQADGGDGDVQGRIARLESELAAAERDREAKLTRLVAELEQRRRVAAAQNEAHEAGALAAAQAREAAEKRLERAHEAVRDAERGVEQARGDAARAGGELAAVNQFLRSHAGAPGGAAALADELEVDPGYELAVAAALDGRLGAAVVKDRPAAGALLDRAGADGGRVLVAELGAAVRAGVPPSPSAERLADRVRGTSAAGLLVRALLTNAWLVDAVQELGDDFEGVAVTRAGRVWSPAARELRQAPAVGEDRVLAERNRRDRLVGASEAAVRAELNAAAVLKGAGADLAEAERDREAALAAHRAALRARDEGGEEERRLARLIESRRAAPDEGPGADRRAQLSAELAAERRLAERVQRERSQRERRLKGLRAAITRDEAMGPVLAHLRAAVGAAAAAIAARGAEFQAALEADRRAGEHMAAELRACAQEEAALQARLHQDNETLTAAEVRAQHVRDRASDAQAELQGLARTLELAPEPASEPLAAEEREVLTARLERLGRRREQLGPVNPLAQEEYAEAVEHVEELERQRADLETALRELHKLIAETDRQIRETFEATFAAAARNFEELAERLFPGGRGRLRLVTERDRPPRVLGGGLEPNGAANGGAHDEGVVEPAEVEDEDETGVEIEITPAGKAMKRLTLLSGGEKSMTALAFLFAVFLARPCPFYILDEVEAALDDLNIDRFLDLVRQYSARTQFIVVTHQKRTMEAADSLYGISMGADGISKVVSRRLPREAVA